MKKIMRRWEAVLICMALLFSLFSLRTAEAKNEETLKTIFPVHVIHKTGDDKENFVIVIMGDGYTADEQDKFLQDAKQKAQGMLRWSPYKEYSDHINIYAVQAVSNESGISVYGGKNADTYFHVKVYGKAASFSNGGDEKAKELRQDLEQNYLDRGANVATIHVLCNSEGSYGASVNSLFSFSTNSEDNEDGMVMAHETAHSIGGLGDEYERYTNKPNTSDTSNPDTIKWSKMLGFRGIGVTMAGTETAFAPSRECMMRWLGQPFCEVCKMELARKLNNTDYVSNPEISIPHSKTGTLDRDSEKYRISEKNITKANNTDLEFRTVVQNLVNREQHLKMSFQIIGADGKTVKYQEEKTYTIPALSNSYNPDEARESLSIVFSDVYGLSNGDRLDGKVINVDTGEVLATDKTAEQEWSRVNIHYQVKNADGTGTLLPCADTATVYVPKNSTYILRNPELSGYILAGNSLNQDELKVTEADTDITYYYQVKSDQPEETPTMTPTVTPSAVPTATPTVTPSAVPTATPTVTPSAVPTATPTVTPSAVPTATPTVTPDAVPTAPPTITPSEAPTVTPTMAPSATPIKQKKGLKKTTNIVVVVKVTGSKNTSNVSRSVKKAVKKALKKAGRQRKNITVRLKSKSKKNTTLKLDKSTIRFLAAKKVKSVQWDRGKTRVTMSLKKIKKVNKRMKKNVYLRVKKGVLVTYYTRR